MAAPAHATSPICSLPSCKADQFPTHLWTRVGTFVSEVPDLWALTGTCRAAHRARLDPALPAGWLVQHKGEDAALAFLYPSVLQPASFSEQMLTAIVHEAVRLGADPDGVGAGASRATALQCAAHHGHLSVVQALLAADASRGATNALAVAASKGHSDVLTALLGRVTDACSREIALISAVCFGRSATVMALLSAGVNADCRNHEGFTLLMHAVLYSKCDILELLLQAGATPDAALSTGETALTLAARHSRAAEVSALLRGGASPSAAGGWRLFRVVAVEGNVAAVETLLAGGVSPNPPADEVAPPDLPPLLVAAYSGGAAVVAALLRGGADPEATDEDGCTALLLCAMCRPRELCNLAVLDELLRGGANPNARGPLGETGLLLTAYTSHLGLLRKLLDAGADPELATHGGITPLAVAVRLGHVAAVEALLAAGARPNSAWQAG